MDTNTRRAWNADPFLLVLLALSLAANVWLGLKVRRATPPAPPTPKLNVGDRLPPVLAQGLDGQPATLRAADAAQPTVFYVYSHTCGWCGRNRPAVAALAEKAGTRFRFLGLCLGPQGGCARQDGDPPFPLYANVDPRTRAEMGLGSVPQTIVVAPDGKVVRIFNGAWVEDLREEVGGYFGVDLPRVEAGGGAH